MSSVRQPDLATLLGQVQEYAAEESGANEVSPFGKLLATVAGLSGLAIFIIGCVGAAGKFPNPTMGWVTAGLSGTTFVASLGSGDPKKRKCDLLVLGLVTATLATLGVLGGMGIISAKQLGWGIIGTVLATAPFRCCSSCFLYGKAFMHVANNQNNSQSTQTSHRRRSAYDY